MSEKRLKPDFTDPLAWAKTAETHANRLRQIASQLGLDAPKLILGDVLVLNQPLLCHNTQVIIRNLFLFA